MSSAKFAKKIKSLVKVFGVGSTLFGGLNYHKNDEKFFSNFLMPLTRLLLDAESVHRVAIFACKHNLLPVNKYEDPKTLVWHITTFIFFCLMIFLFSLTGNKYLWNSFEKLSWHCCWF